MRQTFPTDTLAREWEHKVLKRLKVIQDGKWLNRGTGKAIPILIGRENGNFGRKHTDEVKQIVSLTHKGKIISLEHRRKLSLFNSGEGNPNYGKKHTDEAKRKISEASKKRKITEETRLKMSESHKGKPKSSEHKMKIGNSHRGMKYVKKRHD